MNNEFLVPTGSIIKEYLEDNHISQKDLSQRIGISEKHISNLVKGKSRLTEEVALKLEKIFSTIPASYWLNYEVKYREYLARQEELKGIELGNLEVISKRFKFGEVFKGLDLTPAEQAIAMLKLLKISDFGNFESVYGNLQVEFMEDGGAREAIAIWLNMCDLEIEIQNCDLSNIPYCESELKKNLKKFKLLSNNNDTPLSLASCRKLCNKMGIYLVVCEAITNSKVRGALTTYEGHPAIYLSGRFKSHSHIWFAFMHELGHLLLHYNKRDTIISYESDAEEASEREEEANAFARDVFVDPLTYRCFVEKGKYDVSSIKAFAKQENTLPEIVVARLQHDKVIGFDQHVYLK